MNWRRIAFWFGVLALVDAVLLVLPLGVPGGALAGLVPYAVVPLLALIAAGYGIKVLAASTGDVPMRERPTTVQDEAMDVDRVGSDIDEAFDALTADDATTWSTLNAGRMLRSELRRGTITALEARGHPREEAERLVDSGVWTDDRRAAAFLGDKHLPLRVRVRDWASGDAERRKADAATEELLRLTETPDDSGSMPRRHNRRPANTMLGDPTGTGERAQTERAAELEPEVDA